jgi:hypothetical protein
LTGVHGKDVRLTGGQIVTADDEYIRNSILNPQGQIVEGYQPIMPTFKGQVTEEQLVQLVAYIKSLGGNSAGGTTTRTTSNTNTASGNNMNADSGSGTNSMVPRRAERGNSNTQGSNPNAPGNTSEPTRRQP